MSQEDGHFSVSGTKVEGNDGRVTRSCIYSYYRRFLSLAGISHNGTGFEPRLHDLRVTFAVHSLKRLTEENDDVNACLYYRLHLRDSVTIISPKLATSDAATSYWMRFPLINLYILLGVPFVPPVHNQGVGLAPLQGHALW